MTWPQQSRDRVRVGGPAPGSGLGGPDRVHCKNLIANGAFYADLGPAAPGLFIDPPGPRQKRSGIGAGLGATDWGWHRVTRGESLVPLGTVRRRESGRDDSPADVATRAHLGDSWGTQGRADRLAAQPEWRSSPPQWSWEILPPLGRSLWPCMPRNGPPCVPIMH